MNAARQPYGYHFSKNLVGVSVAHMAGEENVTTAAVVLFATIFPFTIRPLTVIGSVKVWLGVWSVFACALPEKENVPAAEMTSVGMVIVKMVIGSSVFGFPATSEAEAVQFTEECFLPPSNFRPLATTVR
jgi:hypothetical protein